MSYFDQVAVQGADSPTVDAFGRWRVSDPVTTFDSTLQYNTNPLQWEDILNGGTVTHAPNSSGATLSTAAGTSGNYAYRQTRSYMRYQPGKSQLIVMTGVMGALKANVRQRVGYFDASDGAFFEQDGTNLKVVLRTSTSGSPSDANAVNQSAWNLDKMNGSGTSGVTIDTSKDNIFVIDLQWLGAGRVRMGFDVGGKIIYCHEFRNANALTVPYMKTANLPCRWEIQNTAAAAGATTLLQVCTTVISEGGFEDDRGYDFTANNGITGIGVTTRRAILSIRPAATLNSIVFRGVIIPRDFTVITKTNDSLVELVYDPTFTVGGGALTWTAADAADSGVEYCVHGDANAGAITNGIPISSLYGTAGSGANRVAVGRDTPTRLPLVLDSAGANPKALSVVVTSLTGTSTNNAALNWKELR
jgi:hypothetical protein